MKTLSVDSLKRSTLSQHMTGGKVQSTLYYQFLPTLVHGHGSNGGGDKKSTDFRNMSSLTTIIHVFALAGLELSIRA